MMIVLSAEADLIGDAAGKAWPSEEMIAIVAMRFTMIAKYPKVKERVPNTLPMPDDHSVDLTPPVIMRMPPKRQLTLRVRYVNKGKGKPRPYRLDE